MQERGEALRVGAVAAAGVCLVFGITFVLVAAPDAPAGTMRDVGRAAASVADTLGYDLAGLPADAVLVVQRKEGPKGAFVEVARSSGRSGRLPVDISADGKSILRFTVVTPAGDVLMSLDRGR
jgi:hypothetical protein